MKVYQLVCNTDGTRSAVLSTDSFTTLAENLRRVTLNRPEMVDYYVLVLMEDNTGDGVSPSRAPMMRVSTVIETFGESK